MTRDTFRIMFARYSLFCRRLGDGLLLLSALALVAMTGIVGWQVWGRYVLNDTPISAEPVSLIFMLYLSLLGAAVGVREGFHMGVVFVLERLAPRLRRACAVANHLLVGGFALGMVWYGTKLAAATATHTIPTVGISEAVYYASIPLSGAAMLLFIAEHLIALAIGREVAIDAFRDADHSA